VLEDDNHQREVLALLKEAIDADRQSQRKHFS
jgi:hypothetical protein